MFSTTGLNLMFQELDEYSSLFQRLDEVASKYLKTQTIKKLSLTDQLLECGNSTWQTWGNLWFLKRMMVSFGNSVMSASVGHTMIRSSLTGKKMRLLLNISRQTLTLDRRIPNLGIMNSGSLKELYCGCDQETENAVSSGAYKQSEGTPNKTLHLTIATSELSR